MAAHHHHGDGKHAHAAAAATTTAAAAAQPQKQPERYDDDDDSYEEEVDRWILDPSEIALGKKLGKGAFGVVYLGTLRGKDVAVKKITSVHFDDETLEAFRKEVAILSKLRHPNVLLFMVGSAQGGLR